jgi:26S proteasome regulatory subunit N11
MLNLTKNYNKSVQEEETMSANQLKIRFVGKIDPERHLESQVERSMSDNIVQSLGTMLENILF